MQQFPCGEESWDTFRDFLDKKTHGIAGWIILVLGIGSFGILLRDYPLTTGIRSNSNFSPESLSGGT